MFDANLSLQQNLPVCGQTNNTMALDLGVDTQAFSDQWRQGRLRVFFPAMPNATNNAASITLTLQDSMDGGNTFQNCQPLCQVVLPGVSPGGIPAQPQSESQTGQIDFPLPPTLRGPLQVQQYVPLGIGGDCSSVVIQYWWVNE
jgi:hypothetical protein